jgi:hypothetical protein
MYLWYALGMEKIRVIDCTTGATVALKATRKAARAYAERLNQAYGATRYTVPIADRIQSLVESI